MSEQTTCQNVQDRRGTPRYVVKSATRAQIKAARMLLAREKAGMANPSDKARAVARKEPDRPVDARE